MDIDVLITAPYTADVIQVRWNRRLEGMLLGLRRDIESAIDELEGVERVAVTRYRALVYVVTDIRALDKVVDDLCWVFMASPLLQAPAVTMNKVRFNVSAVPV